MRTPDSAIEVCSTPDELAERAASRFISAALRSVESRGRFAVCLSGGSTPRAAYALLGQREWRQRVPWDAVHVFWGDERCIPVDRADNHFRMASDLFLDAVPIPPQNVHRMRGEDPARDAATGYDHELRSFFGGRPVLDLVYLGMGADGHTASIFPGSLAELETDRLVIAHYVARVAMFRLTCTFPMLNSAREILFLVSGPTKAEALRAVTTGNSDLPAARIRPANGTVHWLVDVEAASRLESDAVSGRVRQ